MKSRSLLALGAAMLAATAVIVASAQAQVTGRAPFWPDLTNPADFKVNEWYSDLPWHQKLGTYAGNQIDEAIILPYLALPPADRQHCEDPKINWSPPRCMIEFGVNNILGMKRTDRLYDPTQASTPTKPSVKDAPECQDATLPCIEVMLTVANYYYTKVGDGIGRVSREFGVDQPDLPFPVLYSKYNINDGTIYAPQMPWYMSHYCDGMFTGGDLLDPVCYADYLSTFNDGFNAFGTGGRLGWPRAVPWSAWPQADTNRCAQGIMECSIVLAGFDLKAVPSAFTKTITYYDNNNLLLQWFNNALTNFPADQGTAENQRHFPWSGKTITWDDFYKPSAQNPFLGTFENVIPNGSPEVDCYATLTGPRTRAGAVCVGNTTITRAKETLYPRRCTLEDLNNGDAERLRKCSLNYEMHHNGWIQQWPKEGGWESAVTAAKMVGPNQYGRTSFLFAGVPGMQMPVSFYKNDSPSGLSIYEQVHNSSLFSLYIPIANEADTKRALIGRQYTSTEFYHTLLMTNHMEADPDVFADGIRGKTLWHNEYRMQGMYSTKSEKFPPQVFNAAFSTDSAKLPFHSNTCDSCHVRNGSGVPINTEKKLDALLKGMTTAVYNPKVEDDYTFTGDIRPMKLVLFDLGRSTARADASRFSEPLAFTPLTLLQPPRAQAADLYYTNAIMNFYGDSYHVTAGNSYTWSYGKASDESVVVSAKRANPERPGVEYTPWQVNVSAFTIGAPCAVDTTVPRGVNPKAWPATCDDVNGEKIAKAIQGREVGYILLNGKRLGNSSSIEAMPNEAIKGFRRSQVSSLGADIAGELIWTEGTRGGISGKKQLECRKKSLADCFIGRFGWLGDRASLEDQVANAAFVEMNMTSSEGYKKLYPSGKTTAPLRYLAPNCGPANKTCTDVKVGNTDLSELDIERMADYSRWIGNPTRSEFQVTLPEVVAGERVFRKLKCDTCHVIDRINIVPEDTMLSAFYRDRLEKRVVKDGAGNPTIQPFLSYLGTDLLMHDMGYLSQVGLVPDDPKFRDAVTGVVDPKYQNYVQKIRTPALKGMRFNRFVTESYQNTTTKWNAATPNDPACDFLLHDGRACDAVEAAFLHDGPAIKKLEIIENLSGVGPLGLSAGDITNLRAFLYSL